MHKHENINYSEIRKEVSKLYFEVLTQKLSVKEALLNFPKNFDDKTITASWHALCHLEADEDYRQKDSLYRQEQDEYLEFIAFTLQKGEELPQNIINEYLPYYSDALMPLTNNFKGILRKLKKFLT